MYHVVLLLKVIFLNQYIYLLIFSQEISKKFPPENKSERKAREAEEANHRMKLRQQSFEERDTLKVTGNAHILDFQVIKTI